MLKSIAAFFCIAMMLSAVEAAEPGHGGHTPAVQNGSEAVVLAAGDVKALLDSTNKPDLIDVRSLPEYKFGHIPGAVNIPSPAIRTMTSRLPKDKASLIIIYARGDSHMATDKVFNILFKMGYTNLKLFRGGILEWKDQHYKIKKGERP